MLRGSGCREGRAR